MISRIGAALIALLASLPAFAAAPTFDESPTGVQTTGTTIVVASYVSVAAAAFNVVATRENGTSNFLDTCLSVIDGNMPIITDGTDTASIGSTGNRLEVFGRPNATADADSGSCTASSSATIRTLGALYDGVHTTVPYGNVVTGTFASTTTPSLAITTTWSDALVLCFVIMDTGGTAVPGDTETSRQTLESRMNLEDIDATTPGVHTCNWTLGSASVGAMVAIELKSTTSTEPSAGLNPFSGSLSPPGRTLR